MEVHTMFLTVTRQNEYHKFISEVIGCIYNTLNKIVEIQADYIGDDLCFALQNNNVYVSLANVASHNLILYISFELDMGNKSKITTITVPIIENFTDDIRNEIVDFVKEYVEENNK